MKIINEFLNKPRIFMAEEVNNLKSINMADFTANWF